MEKTEDVFHFLVECLAYKGPRDILFNSITANNGYFQTYDGLQKFIWLLTSENINDVKLVAMFLNNAMPLRVAGRPF